MDKKMRICDMPGIYLLDTKNNAIEYKIVTLNEDDQTKYFLIAVGDCWASHVRNTVLFKITDTGNGIKLDRKYQVDTVGLIDYSTIDYYRMLLSYACRAGNIGAEYTLLAQTQALI